MSNQTSLRGQLLALIGGSLLLMLVAAFTRAVAGAECNTVIELKQAQHDAFPPLLS